MGTEWVIEGWADLEQRQVLLTIIIDLPASANQSITNEAYTNNLQLSMAYQAIILGQEHPALPAQTLANALNWPLGNQKPP